MLNDLQRIEHMIDNAGIMLQLAASLTKEDYVASVEKQYAMKFAFVMLGEDAAAVSDELKHQYPDIPWQTIKSMRNTVAHDYSKTDETIVWETVVRDIKPLRQRLLQIQSELQASKP